MTTGGVRTVATTLACTALLIVATLATSTASAGRDLDQVRVVPLADSDPTGSIRIDKTNSAGGEEPDDRGVLQPGDSFDYSIAASCSNIEVDCVDLTVVDTFPAELEVDESTLPTDIPGFREVTWTPPTLSVTYTEPLTNPSGETGMVAGGGDSFTVRVEVPTSTTLETGDLVTNEATVSASNVAEDATDPSTVEVLVPRTIDASTTKSFSDSSAIAGDPDATTTIELVGTDLSSANAEVDTMVIEDATPATWEHLDLTAVTVTALPAGASQAQLLVCPESAAPCDDDGWVEGGTAGPPLPATLPLPPSVPADEVVGVRIVVTADDGEVIAPGGAASVSIETTLRDTVRSTGEPIDEIPTTTTVDNCATTSVTDDELDPATVTSDPGCAQYQILPPTLVVAPEKRFFADADGDGTSEPGEHAVIGEESGVTAGLSARNDSAFPIAEVVITEPVDPNEFEKVDAESVVLTFPAGAVSASVEISYSDGSSTEADHAAPGPVTIDLPAAPPRVASITVTYAGDPTIDGGATIEPGSVAGVTVHGHLNDLVDEDDVGSLAGIDDCAGFTGSGGGIPGSTGTFSGEACATLPIEERNASAGGDKVPSQDVVPVDQPIVFTMSTTNDGNLPLIDVVVSDPPTGPGDVPPLTPLFEYGRFLGAEVAPAAMQSRTTIEVYSPTEGWRDLDDVDPAEYPDVIGVRALVGVLQPTESFDLQVGMIARDPDAVIPPDTVFLNCYSVTAAGDELEAQTVCAPPLQPQPIQEGAAVDKFISPEVLPRPLPGMDPQTATVQLRIQNEGTITARTLQITDDDADFWDAVDFVGLGAITGPPVGASDRADRIQVDALTDLGWQDGTPVSLASAALPSGVAPGDVRGLRFTFSDTSPLDDGFVLTPCTGSPVDCAGIVELDVSPRILLRSTGAPVPDALLDTATGAFTTRLHPDPADPALIAPVSDDLTFREGDPELDVDKTPELTTLQPGQLATFELATTNTGTANLPDLTVADPLPEAIAFDTTFVGDGGQPYTVEWQDLPDGYPAPPAPTFDLVADPDEPERVGLVRWTFAGWDMPPGSTVTILFRYSLEPGVAEGDTITNVVGASSPIADLACADPSSEVADGPYGAGVYCTDPGAATVSAGANFVSRKWVAGNPDLGWFNQSTGQLVPVGDPRCLALDRDGRTYTTNPCVAIVDPGEQFHYVLRVQNAGTEDALRMTIVDTFPAPGDTGVLGADRGTEWSTAPTLSGPATYVGPATGEIGYTTQTSVCIDDLDMDGPPCPATDWDDAPDATTTALRLAADFSPEPLAPGAAVEVWFTMDAPLEIPRVSDPTIAWNSIAHAEVTQMGASGERVLSPLEPLKVGVAALYGTLEVVKEIGDDPEGLDRSDTAFTFAYECTTSTGLAGPSGEVEATPTEPGSVPAIPAGSTCTVWETDTAGGISSATEAEPATVTIEPSLAPDAPTVSSVTVTNDYPLAELVVTKVVENGTDPTMSFPFLMSCTTTAADGTIVDVEPVSGPSSFELAAGESVTVVGRPGWRCSVEETDDGGATATYAEWGAIDDDPTDGAVTMGDGVAVTVTNSFAPPIDVVDDLSGGVDPAALARTGATAVAVLLLLGSGLLGSGVVLRRAARTRRTGG